MFTQERRYGITKNGEGRIPTLFRVLKRNSFRDNREMEIQHRDTRETGVSVTIGNFGASLVINLSCEDLSCETPPPPPSLLCQKNQDS